MTTLRSYWQTSSKVFGRGSSSTHENLEKCEFAIRPVTAHMLSKAPPRPREMFRTVLIHVKSRMQKNKRVAGLSGWILLWQDPPRRDPLASPTIPVSRPGPRPSRLLGVAHCQPPPRAAYSYTCPYSNTGVLAGCRMSPFRPGVRITQHPRTAARTASACQPPQNTKQERLHSGGHYICPDFKPLPTPRPLESQMPDVGEGPECGRSVDRKEWW